MPTGPEAMDKDAERTLAEIEAAFAATVVDINTRLDKIAEDLRYITNLLDRERERG